MTTYTPERVEIVVDGHVVAETLPRVVEVSPVRSLLAAALTVALALPHGDTRPPADPRRSPVRVAQGRPWAPPKPPQVPTDEGEAVTAAAEKRARKASKLEAVAARGGIRRSS